MLKLKLTKRSETSYYCYNLDIILWLGRDGTNYAIRITETNIETYMLYCFKKIREQLCLG